ncbi:PhoH-like protein [Vibrio phage vB_VhaP_PG11]|nr:PhoH-like protein [Vibrio phage vB_VhaP_PG11]
MAKTDKRPRRQTREEKVTNSFKEAAPLQPLTQGQSEYIHALKHRPIIVCTGYAGTSKTYCATRVAALLLKQGAVDKLVYARPAVSASKSLGFFKGDKVEKMKEWVAPVMDVLKLEFSFGQLEYMMKEEIGMIEGVPLETIKGRSFKDTFVLVDEAEDLTVKEIVSLLTRIGENTTLVLAGDIAQSDLSKSGLGEFLKLRSKNQKLQNAIEHIDFNEPEDIVRSDVCRDIILGLEEIGQSV